MFAAGADIVGYWKLNAVLLGEIEVSFDNRKLNLTSEYFGFFADKHLHHIEQFASDTWADNAS